MFEEWRAHERERRAGVQAIGEAAPRPVLSALHEPGA
jgi:hypothetical protein